MKYEHICAYVARTPWAIIPEKLQEMVSVLAYRASGHAFTAEELRARLGEREESQAVRTGRAVAIVPIRGVIAPRMDALEESSGGTSAEGISRKLKAVADNPEIASIIYDVDSPGGSVQGIEELADEMFALRGSIRQVVHVNGLGASAAYWLSSQADEIVAAPSALVGSIGVLTAHTDLSKALEQEGVNVTVLSAGKYKTEGLPFAPLSDDAKAFRQAQVDEFYGRFVSAVARGRGVTEADVRAGYGQGRVLVADAALEAKLIDRVDTLDATVARELERASPQQAAAASERRWGYV